MIVFINKHLFDTLGFCKSVELNVRVNSDLNMDQVNENLVTKSIYMDKLIEDAVKTINENPEIGADFNMLEKISGNVISKIDVGTDTDVEAYYFNCDETDTDVIKDTVLKSMQAGILPAIILAISNEEAEELKVNSTLMTVISMKNFMNKQAIATMVTALYDIPDIHRITTDKDKWGFIYTLVAYRNAAEDGSTTSEMFPLDINSTAFTIYEKAETSEENTDEE